MTFFSQDDRLTAGAWAACEDVLKLFAYFRWTLFFSLIVRVRVQLFVFFQQKFKKQITARKFLFGFLYSPLLLSDDIWVCLSHYTARIWSIQINIYDMKRHTYRRNYWLWTDSLISFAEGNMKFETFNIHSRISLRLLTAIDCSQQAAALCQRDK